MCREQEVGWLVMTYQPKRERSTSLWGTRTQGQSVAASLLSSTHRVSHRTAGINVPMSRVLYMHRISSTTLRGPRSRDTAGQQTYTMPRSWLLNLIASHPPPNLEEVDDAWVEAEELYNEPEVLVGWIYRETGR